MILAADQPAIFEIAIGAAILIFLGGLVFSFFRGYEWLARRSLIRKYDGINVHDAPQEGDVILTYHTYHGFIAWFTQTPHHVALPPADAEVLLGRLLRFNLTWGLVTLGSVFVVRLAVLNYLRQRHAMADQVADAAFAESRPTISPDVPIEAVDESPSLFHRVFGRIAAGICIVFGINVLVCLVIGEYEAAIGSLVVPLLFGSAARFMLSKRPRGVV